MISTIPKRLALTVRCANALKPIRLVGLACVCLALSASAEPFCQGEPIFPLQAKHVHSSCIVECPNGDLLVCWFRGSGERTAPDVVIEGARLRQGSSKWSPVFQMADTPNIPDCNPVMFIDANDELWLFWIAVPANSWEDSLLRYRKSKAYQADGAPKWYWQNTLILKPGERFAEAMEKGFDSMELPDLDYGGHAGRPVEALVEAAKNPSLRQKGWMPRTHLNVLPSGRILLPLYSDGYYVGLMAISDDGGKNWRASEPIVGLALNQPSVVRKKDGTLIAYMRSEGAMRGFTQTSVSSDDGESWSTAISIDVLNPNSSLEVIALQDGRWVMAFNDTPRGRANLTLALSDDEGKTWKWKRRLEEMPGGQFHYPSIIQTRDGQIHITYTHQPGAEADKTIKHVAVNADWITKGK